MKDDTSHDPPVRTVLHRGSDVPTNTGPITQFPFTVIGSESESDFIARLNCNVRAINANFREVNARNLKVEARVDAKDGVVELTVTLFRPIDPA